MGFARWLISNPALRGSCGPIPVLRAARLKIASHVGQKCLLAHICILDLLEIPTILAALLPAPVSRPLTRGFILLRNPSFITQTRIGPTHFSGDFVLLDIDVANKFPDHQPLDKGE